MKIKIKKLHVTQTHKQSNLSGIPFDQTTSQIDTRLLTGE